MSPVVCPEVADCALTATSHTGETNRAIESQDGMRDGDESDHLKDLTTKRLEI